MCIHHWIITEDGHREGHFTGKCRRCDATCEYTMTQPKSNFTAQGINLKYIFPESKSVEN